MPQDSVYEGINCLLHEIPIVAIEADLNRGVALENPSFPTSYDLGPACLVVPGTISNAWTPQDLPIVLPVDLPAIDPRTVLAPCPLDPMFRAIQITSPDLALNEFDLITDRKNLRALLNFFRTKNRESHRIEAELIGGTLLFYLGWSAWGYTSSPDRPTYGMSFESRFTGPRSEGTIQHNRVVTYVFGGLKVMAKYQVDACLASASTPASTLQQQHVRSAASTTPTGLHVISSGSLVPPETVVEIKTVRAGYHFIHSRIMAQLWFSQTPILITGYHDGKGRFSSIEETNVMESGALKLWEMQNTAVLQKVVCLIEMIREHLTNSPIKRQAIVLEKTVGASVKFYSLLDGHKTELPDDLRRIWS